MYCIECSKGKAKIWTCKYELWLQKRRTRISHATSLRLLLVYTNLINSREKEREIFLASRVSRSTEIRVGEHQQLLRPRYQAAKSGQGLNYSFLFVSLNYTSFYKLACRDEADELFLYSTLVPMARRHLGILLLLKS